MSIKYSLSLQRNPQEPDAPRKFYARAQMREVIDLRRLSREIAYASSLTPGDVLNVLDEMSRHVADHLADGDMVDLGDFGRLQYQLSSKGADTEEDFKSTHIKRARLQFRPGYAFRQQQTVLQYEKVLPLKAVADLVKPSEPENPE